MRSVELQTDAQSKLRHMLAQARWAELKAISLQHPTEFHSAFEHIGFTHNLTEQAPQALLIYANLSLKIGANSIAGWSLYYAAQKLGGVEKLPLPMQNVMLRHHPLWTEDVMGDRVILARPRERHQQDLLALFSDQDFTSRFNAFLPPPEMAAKEFIKRTTSQFENNKQIHWLIQTRQGRAVGLVTLSGFDYINRRAEIQFGFNNSLADGRARMEAFQLVLYLSFNELKLAKLCSLVYSTNQAAQNMTLKMGLTQEGCLRKHLLLPGQSKPIDIYVNAMLLEDFKNSPVVKNHSRLAFKTYDPTKLFEQNRSVSISH
ncbi:GNAT family N-acetyltransferase [Limnohabitans sp. Hippo4]|uniref:GNAT family N-acetyltransferase n=1 Tax=Limnohabitans sp. Hippo4 TaxID=1826167 RepID=UPI001304A480|nr:GNAT family N-acetyltransferase [Limnohabitans sp. Hippo4]